MKSDLTLNSAVSWSKKLMIYLSNIGQDILTIQLINPKTEEVLDKVEIPKSFYGPKFSKDDRFPDDSGGNDTSILKYEPLNSKLLIRIR